MTAQEKLKMPPTNLQPCTLNAQTRQIVLHDIVKLWSQRSNVYGLPPVWIREYAVFPGNYHGEAVENYGWPCNAWFLDESGLKERSVWDYQWFHVFQFVQPWSSLWPNLPNPALWGRHRYEIGLVSFAPLEGQELIYVEYIWGGTYGRGDLMRVSEQGALECVENIMIF